MFKQVTTIHLSLVIQCTISEPVTDDGEDQIKLQKKMVNKS